MQGGAKLPQHGWSAAAQGGSARLRRQGVLHPWAAALEILGKDGERILVFSFILLCRNQTARINGNVVAFLWCSQEGGSGSNAASEGPRRYIIISTFLISIFYLSAMRRSGLAAWRVCSSLVRGVTVPLASGLHGVVPTAAAASRHATVVAEVACTGVRGFACSAVQQRSLAQVMSQGLQRICREVRT